MRLLDKHGTFLNGRGWKKVWIPRPGRIERPTHSLEGCCSIQLSYGRIVTDREILG